MQSTLGLCSEEELLQIAQLKLLASSRLVGTRDVLGLRRLVVLVTASGKAYGLHSADGRVLWRSQLPTGRLPTVDVRMYRLHHDNNQAPEVRSCASSLAGISVSSPRKIVIFTIQTKYFLDQSIQRLFYYYLKTEALVRSS